MLVTGVSGVLMRLMKTNQRISIKDYRRSFGRTAAVSAGSAAAGGHSEGSGFESVLRLVCDTAALQKLHGVKTVSEVSEGWASLGKIKVAPLSRRQKSFLLVR